MSKRIWMSVLSVLLLILATGVAQAQEPTPRPTPTNIPTNGSPPAAQDGTVRGSIRGTIYDDQNGDGKCIGTGEPVLAGIPIQFVSNDGATTVYLQSGSNGTYGLVAAGLGRWTVKAEPPAGMVVTSKSPLEALLTEEQRLVLGVDFCVAKGTARPGGLPGGAVLPVAGAAVAPSLVWSALIGAGFVATGLGLEWRRRQHLSQNRTLMNADAADKK
ncbi:MAG: hypothetical protein L0332_12745 [Chloroflexi bacterium]|nr:hypothetical protein [Chloroflexota bacterium]MCI0581258.1 hypothetical protein [Chloroflexota bacterium]MCI0644256.1 hypothetical protein [Chloroflexota bacterium]MCI0727575.1 hypothetical protein [Chloroflexota bacterium]